MSYKTLILSPHLDDEVLGCYSFLAERNVFVLYGGSDEEHITGDWVEDRPSREARLDELKKVKEFLGFNYEILDNKVNHYSLHSLIPQIERVINHIRPDTVLLPCPSYNQDHRMMYDASLTALRPHDRNHFVKEVYVYEQIQDLWNKNAHGELEVNLFKPLNIDGKLKAYSLYASQVRSFRSSEMIRALATLRGAQANLQSAEAFKILRKVKSL